MPPFRFGSNLAFGLLPQRPPDRYIRLLNMVDQMDEKGFGNCTNHGECEDACPKEISLKNIARMNRDQIVAKIKKGA